MLIHIERAENLASLDLSGASDPFVKVFYDGKEVGVTAHVRKTLNPTWNTAVYFPITAECFYAVLEVWDKDDLSQNDKLGSCRVHFDCPDLKNEKQEWAYLVKGPHPQGRILVHVERESEDFAALKQQPPKPDIRDIYPPHDERFKPRYHHIPRSWHPDHSIRLATEGPRDLIVPQNERVLYMVEEITLTFHINEGSNIGELATMVLTNYRLWFVPYKPIEHGEDVHAIAVGKIARVQIVDQKKGGKVLVIENLDGSIYHAILSRISRIKDEEKLRIDAEAKREAQMSRLIQEIEWLKDEGDFCYEKSHEVVSDETFHPHHRQHHPDLYDKRSVETAAVTAAAKHEDDDVKDDDEEDMLRHENPYLNTRGLLRLSVASSTASIESQRPPSSLRMHDEFERQGVLDHPRWRTTDANATYQLCPTYPSLLVVPRSVSDDSLAKAAQYRSKERLPVLTWIHPYNGAALCRSSQPRSGVMRAQNTADIELIWAIRDAASPKDSPSNVVPSVSTIVHIVDARPEINAKGNALAGKGHESTKQYDREGASCSRIVFMGIDNIHVVRSSFATFAEACYTSDDSSFFGGIQKSRWYEHVKSILHSSVEIVQNIARGEPVLVHCSDGWDRTAQLASLAQIMMDPYYRTMEGFAALVEKDWCSFGHMFELRCGHRTSDNTSQIFVLFLDAVYQLTTQFPKCFQFNSLFLIEVCEAVYCGWYGTFVKNCERERMEVTKDRCVVSVWDVLRSTTDKYLNPLFEPSQSETNTLGPPMIPACKVRCMQIWSGLYQKAINEIRHQRRENEMLELIRAQEGQISDMLRLLSADQHLTLRVLQIETELHRLANLIELDHTDPQSPSIPASTPRSNVKHQEDIAIVSGEEAMELSTNAELKDKVMSLKEQLNAFLVHFDKQNAAAATTLEQFRAFNYSLSTTGMDDSSFSRNSFRIRTPIWQNDQDAACCKLCRKNFKNIFRKRHHCRSCGYIFCGKCSNHFMSLPEYGYHDNVRVCLNCHKKYNVHDANL